MRKFVLLILLAGCASEKPLSAPETIPVSGKVILSSGTLLPAGRVILKPENPGVQEASSEVENGLYQCSAQPGTYKVVVELATYKSGSMKKVTAAVAKKYQGDTSPLRLDVGSGKGFDLRLAD